MQQACWPDEVRASRTALNDISRMNETLVASVHQPRSVAEIQALLALAAQRGLPLVPRGTKHSMGGHSLSAGAMALDMCYLNAVVIDAVARTASVGAGATWADVIVAANAHGLTPRTLQSYCTFSVGGTLSVNGHGITSDHCVAESVEALTVVKACGRVVTARRSEGASAEERELFSLCLGGYGLFGIIAGAVLRLDTNVRLALDVVSLALGDVPPTYDSLLAAGDVEMKLARLDSTTLDSVELFIFRRDAATPTVSALPAAPREQTRMGALLYKWLAGPLREARFALERTLGVALDWQGVSDRNEMLFESAAPLARLYSPLVEVDDTFVLQEYFVPRARFLDFCTRARAPVLEGINKEALLTLLNITVRFVQQDRCTALPYAAAPEGSFAFVLYFRLRRSAEADALLRRYHGVLTGIALDLGGTFYLPYRHHYTDAELLQAYPGLPAFCAKRREHDPHGRFTNLWAERYCTMTPPPSAPAAEAAAAAAEAAAAAAAEAASAPLLRQLPQLHSAVAIGRRTGSFRALLGSPRARAQFFDVFLPEILSLRPPAEVHRLMAGAAWDARNREDIHIYAACLKALSSASSASPLSSLAHLWAGVGQLSSQKRELTREVVSCAARLGKVGALHSYLGIGDAGKLVLPLRAALNMKGSMWVAHDALAGPDNTPAVLERGAASLSDACGAAFVRLDYNSLGEGSLAGIASGTIDLVTLNQGLHHMVPAQVPGFLAAIARVLAPGGVFLLREHDLDAGGALLPMLDCAHMVFNLLTGVSVDEERQEVRAFRSVDEWRSIVCRATGLVDAQCYEMQPRDPTLDIMMAFCKPSGSSSAEGGGAARDSSAAAAAVTSAAEQGLAARAQLVLNQVPGLAIEGATAGLEGVLHALPQVRAWVLKTLASSTQAAAAAGQPPNALAAAASVLVSQYLEPAMLMLERFRPLSAAARPVEDTEGLLLPPEFFLLEPALRKRAEAGGKVEAAILLVLDKVLGALGGEEAEAGASSSAAASASASAPAPASDAGSAGAALRAGEVDALLCELEGAVPECRDPVALLKASGLSPKVQAMLRAAFSTRAAACAALAARLDKTAWAEVCAGVRGACASRAAPTLAAVLAPGTPWNRAMRGLLGSGGMPMPSGMQAFAARQVGLGPLLELQAQSKRQGVVAGGSGAGAAAGSHPPPPSAALSAALERLCPTVERDLSGDACAQDISGVLGVVEATYRVKSLTGLFPEAVVPCTDAVAALLNRATGILALSSFSAPSKLLGSKRLVLRYRAAAPAAGAFEAVESAAGTLGAVLLREGLLDESRAGNARNNLYKLPEWMQVEIVQAFGDSMHHTPWFRFPFYAIMETYFSVLMRTTSAVAARHGGYQAALACTGFLTDFIPGLVMAAVFGQMSLLAQPLCLALGAENHVSSEVEELVLTAPRDFDFAACEERLRGAREVAAGLWLARVPTFKPLTEILMRLALHRSVSLVLISTHAAVHVKVTAQAASAGQLDAMAQLRASALPGVAFLHSFALPHVGGAAMPATQASLLVQVPALLALLRFCHSHQLERQVYDFN